MPESMSAGALVWVVIVPIWLSPVDPFVELVPVKLKQYQGAVVVKSPLAIVTAVPEIDMAVVPMPGQGAVVPTVGQLILGAVLIAKLPTVPLIVKPVGKVTLTLPSVEAVVVSLAQTVPLSAAVAAMRSSLMNTPPKPAALAVLETKNKPEKKTVKNRMLTVEFLINFIFMFLFFYICPPLIMW